MTTDSSHESGFYVKATGAVLLVVALVGGYLVFANSLELQRMLRPEAVRGLLDGLGPWGPVALLGGAWPSPSCSVRSPARRSQWLLAGGVLVARLFPFISFDAVSYLAGLTRLRFSLFAVATLVGMIPMTFLFAHLGGAMIVEEGPMRVLNLLALLGVAGLVWAG